MNIDDIAAPEPLATVSGHINTTPQGPQGTVRGVNSTEPEIIRHTEPATSANSTDQGADVLADSPGSLHLLWSRAAGGEPHYFGASSALSFTKVFSATLRAVGVHGPGLTMSGTSLVSPDLRSRVEPYSLPDQESMSLLTAAYFEQVHPQFPFLHHPTYMQWEAEVMDARRRGIAPDPAHLFFVFAIGAVGALTVPRADTKLPEVTKYSEDSKMRSLTVIRGCIPLQSGSLSMSST
ncbi:hypothetical protein N7470_004284 [Penicillium chermesinum]|nr:hypothetical protein N7470_004284 [Penicillium chermesinum]